MHTKTKRIVVTALMASMVCVMTMMVKIPSPMKGYLNIGDCVVLLCGWLLAPGYGFVAAGLGSALADLFSGYAIYAPATFLIKGGMSLLVFVCGRLMRQRGGKLVSQIVGGVLAEAFMVGGYLVFEGVLYGFAASAVNIPANGVQGGVGLVLGLALIKVLERAKVTVD